jgi:tetratricopeptide (TPR) repeat protein
MVTVQSYLGDLSPALTRCQDLVRLGQEGADRQVRCWGLAVQGFVQQRLGQLDDAIAALREAHALARLTTDLTWSISTSADLGRCYLRQGDLDEALAALDTSLGFYAPYLGGDSYASLRNGLAEAYLFAAEQRSGTEKVEWLKKANGACRDALKQAKAFRPGMPEAMRLWGTCLWLRGKPVAAEKWWRRGLALAGEMGQRYDEGLAHLEMGRRLGDRAHLERARAILAGIGAELDLARAREALGEMRAG